MNKTLQIFLFSTTFFLLFLLNPLIHITDAALSGCGEIDIGNPPANITPPSQCISASNNGGKWPFKTKDPGMFRRADQGWDLQGSSPQVVYAVAAGKVFKANNDPSGFGNYYPYETLDTPIKVGSNTYTDIYYGHIHYADGTHGTSTSVLGTHVKAGDPIGYTYPGCCWPANWLEIGFGNSAPVGHGSFPTVAGLDMEQYLIGKRLDYSGTGAVVGK